MLRFLTAGESHGKGLTVIIEGIPAGVRLDEDYIANELQKDKLLKCDEAERFIPRQSLKGVARFTSEELSKLSESIINAANEAIEIEISIFEDIKNTIIENSQELAELSYSISRIDVASSLAELSSINNFVRSSSEIS